jgi:hypothetical protein
MSMIQSNYANIVRMSAISAYYVRETLICKADMLFFVLPCLQFFDILCISQRVYYVVSCLFFVCDDTVLFQKDTY